MFQRLLLHFPLMPNPLAIDVEFHCDFVFRRHHSPEWRNLIDIGTFVQRLQRGFRRFAYEVCL